VQIVPIGTETQELFIKEWKVPPGFLRSGAGGAAAGDGGPLGGGGLGGPPGGAPSAGAGNAGSNAKDFLAASGVTFGQGAFAMYSPVSNTLIVKGTQEELDRIERLLPQHLDESFPGAPRSRTAGLLPVTLDLPKTGPALVFDGLYAPERLVMRYDDWWSRARALWIWFVAGGFAFYLLAARRPWWRTLWAVLVLSALPLCAVAAWMPVCNALLGGWLAGLVLNRVGVWCVFRVKKEVLA